MYIFVKITNIQIDWIQVRWTGTQNTAVDFSLHEWLSKCHFTVCKSEFNFHHFNNKKRETRLQVTTYTYHSHLSDLNKWSLDPLTSGIWQMTSSIKKAKVLTAFPLVQANRNTFYLQLGSIGTSSVIIKHFSYLISGYQLA